MRAVKGNGEIDRQPNERLFLLTDHDRLPVIDIHSFSKLMDMWRTEGESFYFAMMICCLWSMCLLQTNWWTGEQPKEELFLLWDDDLLLETDVSPSNKLMDRWRTEGETVYTLGWWSVCDVVTDYHLIARKRNRTSYPQERIFALKFTTVLTHRKCFSWKKQEILCSYNNDSIIYRCIN